MFSVSSKLMDSSLAGTSVLVLGVCKTLKASLLPAQFKTYRSLLKVMSSPRVAFSFSQSILPSLNASVTIPAIVAALFCHV